MEVWFATQPPNESGNQTQLVGGTEGLNRSLGLVVTRVRQVAHPHDHTIPLFVVGMPLQRYNAGLILALRYNSIVAWEIEVTDEFKAWWEGLTEAECISVERSVLLLEERGPHLPFPYSSRVNGSRHAAMRELRVQHQGRPYRALYVFDPCRVAILLLGGDKTGDDNWYEQNVPLADRLYDNYLAEIEEEGDAKDDEVQ
jgi:hypothetical protein